MFVCVWITRKMKENKRELNFLFRSLVDFHFLSSWVFVYDMAFLLIKMMSCQFLILLYKSYFSLKCASSIHRLPCKHFMLMN